MKSTPSGRVTIVKELYPGDYNLSVRGSGHSTLNVAGERREIGAEHPFGRVLLAVLHELIRHEFPSVELHDVGHGPRALEDRVTELEELFGRTLKEHQELVIENADLRQRLAEAEAANDAFTRGVEAESEIPPLDLEEVEP